MYFHSRELHLENAVENGTSGAIILKSGKVPTVNGVPWRPDRIEVIKTQGLGGTIYDFGGMIVHGEAAGVEPNRRRGTGVYLSGGARITIRNLTVRGYKMGLYAQDVQQLEIKNGDFSYNWKEKLASTPEREDLSDWMSFHQNEKNEWLRYGAGIYLKNCTRFVVTDCRIVGGQCGLMLTGCTEGRVTSNQFSFLSGIGIGLYRSSDNLIQQNKVDWCVRGYSHGVYNRGQDSAGILIYEQSNRNRFCYNSVTHGGDGFFLWAGQNTMDTGEGGCNDNLVWGNDFSHSPTNGIEATFSRNRFIGNKVLECWHGVWGGYSFDTVIAENQFGYNAQAIAIEHGRDNRIEANEFLRDNEGIVLWHNPTQNSNWAYPKKHDTSSQNYAIQNNRFRELSRPCFTIRDTQRVTISDDNAFSDCSTPLMAREGDTTGLFFPVNAPQSLTKPLPTMLANGRPLLATEADSVAYHRRFQTDWQPSKKVLGFSKPTVIATGKSAWLPAIALRGRRYILVDEWGPYDFESPRLTQREAVNGKENTLRFEVLGPKGGWHVRKIQGVTLSAQSGTVPGTVDVTMPKSGLAINAGIELEYRGEKTTDYKGIVTVAGRPVLFGWHKVFLPIAWDVRFFAWTGERSAHSNCRLCHRDNHSTTLDFEDR